jgi:hypothetical protein
MSYFQRNRISVPLPSVDITRLDSCLLEVQGASQIENFSGPIKQITCLLHSMPYDLIRRIEVFLISKHSVGYGVYIILIYRLYNSY